MRLDVCASFFSPMIKKRYNSQRNGSQFQENKKQKLHHKGNLTVQMERFTNLLDSVHLSIKGKSSWKTTGKRKNLQKITWKVTG